MKIKFDYAGEIQYAILAESTTFTALLDTVKRKYPNQNFDEQQFFYLDDDQEKITIADDEGVRCMLEIFQAQGATQKITVKPKTPAPISPSVPHEATMSTSEQTQNKIPRMALHSTHGAIGNFYNAKTEQFIKDKNFQNYAVEVDEPKENVFLVSSLNDLNERFDRLSVDIEQKLSIISGLTNVSQHGIGNFLLKCFSKKFRHKMLIAEEQCEILHKENERLKKDFVDIRRLQKSWDQMRRERDVMLKELKDAKKTIKILETNGSMEMTVQKTSRGN